MKKIFAFAGAALLVASCSKETTEQLQPDARMVSYSAGEIAGQLDQVDLPMPFTNGKTAALSFTLRAVAEPPTVNGVATKATSVTKVGNKVYVTWHTVNGDFGGAVSVYDVSTPGAISYEGRVDFIDTDFHQGTVEGSSFYVVGQRDPNSGAYDHLLVPSNPGASYWNGAIFGRLSLDGTGLLTTTYAELPTSGYAANGLASTGSADMYDFVTGDGTSKIYRINGATMTLTDSTGTFQDGEFMLSAGGNTYGFDGDKAGTNSRLLKYTNGATLNTMDILAGTGGVTAQSVAFSSTSVDRNAMAVDAAGNTYLAMGANGVVKVTSAGATTQAFSTASVGGTAQGVSVDGTNDRLYIAQGEQGLFLADINGGAFTQLGYAEKVYPTSNYKDVTYAPAVAGTGGPENWLFIADGEKGLLLVEEINTP